MLLPGIYPVPSRWCLAISGCALTVAAQRIARDELEAETRAKFAPELVASSWKRIVLTSAVTLGALKEMIASAQSVGFLRDAPDLSRLVENP